MTWNPQNLNPGFSDEAWDFLINNFENLYDDYENWWFLCEESNQLILFDEEGLNCKTIHFIPTPGIEYFEIQRPDLEKIMKSIQRDNKDKEFPVIWIPGHFEEFPKTLLFNDVKYYDRDVTKGPVYLSFHSGKVVREYHYDLVTDSFKYVKDAEVKSIDYKEGTLYSYDGVKREKYEDEAPEYRLGPVPWNLEIAQQKLKWVTGSTGPDHTEVYEQPKTFIPRMDNTNISDYSLQRHIHNWKPCPQFREMLIDRLGIDEIKKHCKSGKQFDSGGIQYRFVKNGH